MPSGGAIIRGGSRTPGLLDYISNAASNIFPNSSYSRNSDISAGVDYQTAMNEFSIESAKQLWEKQAESDRIAMQFSADEARKLRDWQADQSSTAYQRAVADMRAAGINPILAAANGGASTPAGAAGSGVSSARQAPQLNLENVVASFKSLIRSLTQSGNNAKTLAQAQMFSSAMNAGAKLFGDFFDNSPPDHGTVGILPYVGG